MDLHANIDSTSRSLSRRINLTNSKLLLTNETVQHSLSAIHTLQNNVSHLQLLHLNTGSVIDTLRARADRDLNNTRDRIALQRINTDLAIARLNSSQVQHRADFVALARNVTLLHQSMAQTDKESNSSITPSPIG